MQKFCHGNFTDRRGTSTATPGTVVLPRPRPGEYSPVELRPTFSLANARSFGQGVMHPVGRAVRFAEAGERLDTQIPAALEVDDRLQRDLNPFSPDQEKLSRVVDEFFCSGCDGPGLGDLGRGLGWPPFL